MEQVTKWIKVQNLGSLHIDHITIVGKSLKRSDKRTIGMFGSGSNHFFAWAEHTDTKYAVFSGDHQFNIESRIVPYADTDETQLLYIDGIRTSISAEWSHQWDGMMALREIVANAIDSCVDGGDWSIDIVDDIESVPGFVTIYIELTPELREVMENIDQLFSTRRTPFSSTPHIQVYDAMDGGGNIYYRGMRCVDIKSTRKSIFDYSLLTGSINESRMLSSDYIFREQFTKWLIESAEKRHIVYWLANFMYKDMRDNLHCLDFDRVKEISSTWKSLIENNIIVPWEYRDIMSHPGALELPMTMVEYFKARGMNVSTPLNMIGDYVELGGYAPSRTVRALLEDLNFIYGSRSLEFVLIRSETIDVKVTATQILVSDNINNDKDIILSLMKAYSQSRTDTEAIHDYIKRMYE